jgi:hypothetical protein
VSLQVWCSSQTWPFCNNQWQKHETQYKEILLKFTCDSVIQCKAHLSLWCHLIFILATSRQNIGVTKKTKKMPLTIHFMALLLIFIINLVYFMHSHRLKSKEVWVSWCLRFQTLHDFRFSQWWLWRWLSSFWTFNPYPLPWEMLIQIFTNSLCIGKWCSIKLSLIHTFSRKRTLKHWPPWFLDPTLLPLCMGLCKTSDAKVKSTPFRTWSKETEMQLRLQIQMFSCRCSKNWNTEEGRSPTDSLLEI